MKQMIALLTLGVLFATSAVAQGGPCYADYKARRDSPYDLHYGVMRVSSCDAGSVRSEVRSRLEANGWTLLNVVSVFEEDRLQNKRANAGPYFLRF